MVATADQNWNTGEPNAWLNGAATAPDTCDGDGAAADKAEVPWADGQVACEESEGTCTKNCDGTIGGVVCSKAECLAVTGIWTNTAVFAPMTCNGQPADADMSPEDGVNILGFVSDTGDAVDASDDGAWNDADPAEPRSYVCLGVEGPDASDAAAHRRRLGGAAACAASDAAHRRRLGGAAGPGMESSVAWGMIGVMNVLGWLLVLGQVRPSRFYQLSIPAAWITTAQHRLARGQVYVNAFVRRAIIKVRRLESQTPLPVESFM